MNRCDVWIEDKWQPKTINRTQIAICCSPAIHFLSDQSTNFLIQINNHRLTHTCMNQPSPICVLYLSDASNNKENGRMKIENSDDHTHFFCSTIFFLPSQRPKIHHFSDNYIFYQQRLSNFLYTKVEKLLFGKG